MAEARIAFQMDMVGSGADEATALADAQARYVEMVLAFCAQYGYQGDLLVDGAPTAEAVGFTRARVAGYISDVVRSFRRAEALAEAEAGVDLSGVPLE